MKDPVSILKLSRAKGPQGLDIHLLLGPGGLRQDANLLSPFRVLDKI